MTLQFDEWPWKTIGHLFYATSSFVYYFVAIGEFKLEIQSGNAQSESNLTIFRAVWPWHLTDELEQGNSEGFQSCDRPIVRKHTIWVKISDVLSRVTLKFDGWPWKTIGFLSFAVSSFVKYFIAIGNLNWSYSPETPNLGQIRWVLEPCDLDIWWMTLKNKRAPILCYFKFCASFCSHWWIQIGVTARKRPIWVKIDDFFSRLTFKLDRWPWKTIGHLFYATSSFVHHFLPIGEFKLELQSGNAQFRSKSSIFWAVWPSNLTDDLEKPIGHLFYDTLSFVHHFNAISKFKLKLKSGKTIRVKINFLSRVT